MYPQSVLSKNKKNVKIFLVNFFFPGRDQNYRFFLWVCCFGSTRRLNREVDFCCYMEKPRIEPGTLGLQGEWLNHCIAVKFSFFFLFEKNLCILHGHVFLKKTFPLILVLHRIQNFFVCGGRYENYVHVKILI